MNLSPLDLLAATPSSQTSPAQQSKLVAGAHEFEAMLLQQMLKPLQFGEAAGADSETDTDGNSGGANDTIRSLSVDAVSKAIAQAGGLGIAKQVIQQVERENQHKSSLTIGTGTKVS